MNKHNLQRAIDACLSGIAATPENREAVFRQLRGEKVMKKKITLGFVLAVILALALAGAAIAIGSNLFSQFSQDDPSLQYVANHAQPADITAAASAGEGGAMHIEADSVYYDGATLYLSYRIRGGNQQIEAYKPSANELAEMQQTAYLPVPELSEENAAFSAFVANYKAGAASGYHCRSIGRSDHIATTDGIDLPWETDSTAADGEDLLCYIQFASPLPISVADTDTFTIQLNFFQTDLYVWFDGERLYTSTSSAEAYAVFVTVTKTNAAEETPMTGNGYFNETPVTVGALVSPTAITLTFRQVKGLEYAVFDGDTEAACLSVEPQGNGTVLQTFAGFGTVPETLTVYPVVILESGTQSLSDKEYLTEQAITLAP